uniref:Uncharacterized protein n=1 Tax=Tanacetum cinerariifolium TaxID=118510 RepID=A0A6L2P566_TANCI|nr:hypothetical protein [Tanacetum cinerariifolium]
MGNKGGGDDVAVTVAAMATVVAAAANKGGGAWRRWVVDLIDRDTGNHFRVRRKRSPKNFFDDGSRRRVAGSGGGWPAAGWWGGRDGLYTIPNGDAPWKCTLEGPYTPSTVIISVVPAIDDSPEVPERTTVETILNMSPKNKHHYQSEKEAILFLLTKIRDEIYSTIDARKTAHDMWIAIERLQQESMKSYYSRFYKMVNEMITNNLIVATMQEFGHFAKECRKPKGVKDYTYYKEKMLLCKQAEKGLSLQAEQADWLEDTDAEINEQELEAHYSYMAKI